MKKIYNIYFDNGVVKTFHADKVTYRGLSVPDLIFLDDQDEVIAEFNSDHIAGYSVVEEVKKV